MTLEQLKEMNSEGWKTLGTMMLSERLLIAKNAPEEQIQAQRKSIESYQNVLEQQTNLIAKKDHESNVNE